MTQMVYKIVRQTEWISTKATEMFFGSPDDLRDGFIHLSSAQQVRGTVAKHFADEDGLFLLSVDSQALGDALKWEVSRGGARFPHLYAPLPLDAVRAVRPLPRDGAGGHTFPTDIP